MSDVLSTIAASPWALVAMFGLVLGDAFLVVIPGETAVTALAALSVSSPESRGCWGSSPWPRWPPFWATRSAIS
ncbi:exported hypothetical protein [Microbacterium sp. C448]|uniref:hypothetical protein n=1 Tax=Microbacterium TaxID=33882 RepID=UPI0003DDF9F5|nr:MULTISPECIES: hypothetical protein [Microbacterium]CDK01223.1 exported hypothetical protein [Microbacterium sp. C448]